MEGKRLLRSLRLQNVLSFGPKGMTLDFEPLNVLIGPNGSGKSNLIEILGLLHSLPTDLAPPIRQGGGINEWVWKGRDPHAPLSVWSLWESENNPLLIHEINVRSINNQYVVSKEHFLFNRPDVPEIAVFFIEEDTEPEGMLLEKEFLKIDKSIKLKYKRDQSILAQFRNSLADSATSNLADQLMEMKLYRNWVFGREAPMRTPRAGDQSDFLEENAGNLAAVLRRLQKDPATKEKLLTFLKEAYEGIHDVRVDEISGFYQVSLGEGDGRYTPASRLSDGTLRYLSLIAILCDPEPPPLVCIEEPELGLHPDLVPTIARLLIDASQRCQLVVTTHSADLISALWEFPEAVVVCERGVEGTTMKRLEPDRLKKWLEEYTLGHLWAMGEIGGNRW